MTVLVSLMIVGLSLLNESVLVSLMTVLVSLMIVGLSLLNDSQS